MVDFPCLKMSFFFYTYLFSLCLLVTVCYPGLWKHSCKEVSFLPAVLGCGNIPARRFHFCFRRSREFQVFHFGISTSCSVKSVSTFTHGPLGIEISHIIFLFSPQSLRKRQASLGREQSFSNPPFSMGGGVCLSFLKES